MSFTALHRVVGVTPGPLTDDLLDAAIAAGAVETNDLDWKSELPPAKGLPQTDFPKDVAALANGGGGVIVYGVEEAERAATGRVDVGEFTEVHERALRSAAVTAITPPVFGLDVHRLGAEGNRGVIVEVPASVDGPHLIYKGEYFGAPVRNDSDTVWMKERRHPQRRPPDGRHNRCRRARRPHCFPATQPRRCHRDVDCGRHRRSGMQCIRGSQPPATIGSTEVTCDVAL